jgi:DNA invertase Pin-like site-specific DNA recombinase
MCIRVNTGDQDLQNQKHGILELANKNGWKVDFKEEKI